MNKFYIGAYVHQSAETSEIELFYMALYNKLVVF